MLKIEIKSSPCPKTIIQEYTNEYTNGVLQWGTPCFKVTQFKYFIIDSVLIWGLLYFFDYLISSHKAINTVLFKLNF